MTIAYDSAVDFLQRFVTPFKMVVRQESDFVIVQSEKQPDAILELRKHHSLMAFAESVAVVLNNAHLQRNELQQLQGSRASAMRKALAEKTDECEAKDEEIQRLENERTALKDTVEELSTRLEDLEAGAFFKFRQFVQRFADAEIKAGAELTAKDARIEQLENEKRSLADAIVELTKEIEGVQEGLSDKDDEIAGLQGQIDALESLRPHWAQGYTSDGRAAQASSAALSSLWKKLNVDNQTQAVTKLDALISERTTWRAAQMEMLKQITDVATKLGAAEQKLAERGRLTEHGTISLDKAADEIKKLRHTTDKYDAAIAKIIGLNDMLAMASNALHPFASRVFNDNGDVTVSDTHLVKHTDWIAAYNARKQITRYLSEDRYDSGSA